MKLKGKVKFTVIRKDEDTPDQKDTKKATDQKEES